MSIHESAKLLNEDLNGHYNQSPDYIVGVQETKEQSCLVVYCVKNCPPNLYKSLTELGYTGYPVKIVEDVGRFELANMRV